MERIGKGVERTQTSGEVFRPVALDPEIPIGQPRAGTAAANERREQPFVTGGRDVLEDIAQVEPIEVPRARPLRQLAEDELLERRAAPFEAVEIGANRLEVLRAKRARQRLAMRPGQDPVRVRIGGGSRTVIACFVRSSTLSANGPFT